MYIQYIQGLYQPRLSTADHAASFVAHRIPVYIFILYSVLSKSLGSAVGIATGYGMGNRDVGVQVRVGSRIFTSPYHLDRIWGLHSLLSNGYRG
jgi:hypothetical protein